MKEIRTLKYAICIAFLLLTAALFCACEPPRFMLNAIGEEAREKYDTEYLPAFNASIRELTGFSDLTVETASITSGDVFYHEYDNSVTCYLDYVHLQSDDIDRYYTTKEDSNGLELRSRMSPLLSRLCSGENFSYTREDGITVNVYVNLVSNTHFTIKTSEGREYYYWSNDGSEWVEIDDNFAYFKSKGSSSSKGSSKSSNGSGSSGSTKSYNGSGSSGSTKRYYSADDLYDVDDYNDPDDFAYDYEEEFDDYEDAYDYWEEQQY